MKQNQTHKCKLNLNIIEFKKTTGFNYRSRPTMKRQAGPDVFALLNGSTRVTKTNL